MSQSAVAYVVYDAGALIAAERGSHEFIATHAEFLSFGTELTVPSPVLTQVWRGGARQTGLSRALRACLIVPTSEKTAKSAGIMLGRSKTSDAVDAIVVATALELSAPVITSDPDDLTFLAGAVGAKLSMIVL
jgi:predicted nucleic acid-binding protein